MTAFYNEIDPYCCEWLKNLIKEGLIPDGIVDDRDIREVQPRDLEGFSQCHFFAGISGWGLAARLAGWPDDRPLWTGSCPCQPFSVAGQRKGFDDARHLWPAWRGLIEVCRPPVVVGEQTAGPDGRAWLDRVCDDLERDGYAVWATALPACAVGAPHLRERLWLVAHADGVAAVGAPIARAQRAPWPAEPAVARVVDGLPPRMDRLRSGLGNAIVPQLGAEILGAILDMEG